MRVFYLIAWALLTALVVYYMTVNSGTSQKIIESANSDKVEVIDEVKGSSYTTIDSSSNEDDSGSSAGDSNGGNKAGSKEDFRKEGREKPDYIQMANIKFAENQMKLPPNPKFADYLDSIAGVLLDDKYYVELTGHTSKTVNKNIDNYAIGLKRAEYIKGLLLDRGVDMDKIKVDSKGSDEPREEGDSPETQNKNRRVELKLKTN